ncbi:MAG TPA: DUF6265 family protein [Pyrinomonadaceae bacterium]|nr:DUF6265 family protein [Pyrinomonadaceae bacterium]
MLKRNRSLGVLGAGVAIALILATAFPVIQAQSQDSAHTLKLDEKGVSPPASIAAVSWIAGHRRAAALGGVCEEIWSEPVGNSMVGMFRFVKDGKVVFYELMTIEEDKSLVLKIKHFNPDLSGWERKMLPRTFL